MPFLPVQPLLPWKIAGTILHALAIFSTSYRLYRRFRKNKLWWDDYVALWCGILMEPIYLSMMWVRLHNHGPDYYTKSQKVAHHYLSTFCYMSTIWVSRISLALALARLLPAWTRIRRVANGMVVAFTLCYIVFVISSALVCVEDKAWQDIPGTMVFCRSLTLGMVGAAFDVISDVLLIVVPCFKIWNIQLLPNQRLILLCVFSASFITLLAVTNFLVFTFTPSITGPGKGTIVTMVGHIEAAICVFVCNLQVVFPALYRMVKGIKDDETTSSSVSKPTTSKKSTPSTPSTYVLADLSAVEHAGPQVTITKKTYTDA